MGRAGGCVRFGLPRVFRDFGLSVTLMCLGFFGRWASGD